MSQNVFKLSDFKTVILPGKIDPTKLAESALKTVAEISRTEPAVAKPKRRRTNKSTAPSAEIDEREIRNLPGKITTTTTPSNPSAKPAAKTRTKIFVFGSNREGRHGKGAAKFALENYGASYGQPMGLQGESYAIVTKELRSNKPQVTIQEIDRQVEQLLKFAATHDELEFQVTAIGCGLAGFKHSEIAELFYKRHIPSNVNLPSEFQQYKPSALPGKITTTPTPHKQADLVQDSSSVAKIADPPADLIPGSLNAQQVTASESIKLDSCFWFAAVMSPSRRFSEAFMLPAFDEHGSPVSGLPDIQRTYDDSSPNALNGVPFFYTCIHVEGDNQGDSSQDEKALHARSLFLSLVESLDQNIPAILPMSDIRKAAASLGFYTVDCVESAPQKIFLSYKLALKDKTDTQRTKHGSIYHVNEKTKTIYISHRNSQEFESETEAAAFLVLGSLQLEDPVNENKLIAKRAIGAPIPIEGDDDPTGSSGARKTPRRASSRRGIIDDVIYREELRAKGVQISHDDELSNFSVHSIIPRNPTNLKPTPAVGELNYCGKLSAQLKAEGYTNEEIRLYLKEYFGGSENDAILIHHDQQDGKPYQYVPLY